MLSKRVAALLAALMMLALTAGPLVAGQPETVTVFAAASTRNALEDIAKLREAQGKAKVVLSLASSSTLAKQIANGAPAQVFLSANPEWMDYLAEKKLLVEGSRIDYLGNQLVLIAPADSKVKGQIAPGFALLAWLDGGRLALGDPTHVPAGVYAKQALGKLGVWAQVEPHLALAADVRAALALVERGETPLGVVYSTDAAITPKVRVVAAFPADSHEPIVYPLALVAGQESTAGKEFYDFLRTKEAADIFKKYGFVVR